MSARVFEEVERERVREISRAAFDEQAAALRIALVEAQRALAEADFPVIVLFAGVDGAGKGETVNLLTEWLDPRRIVTHAYDRLTEEEGQRPEFWRYWRDLPARGRFGLFLSAWYSAPLLDRAYGRIGPSALDRRLARIAAFERTLADDGALILKFWMHLDREAQQKRLEALQKHPRDHWRISQWDWRNWHRYEHFNEAAEHTITRTSTAEAPWLVVDGRHARYRSLTVLGMARRALEARLAGLPPPDAGFRARAPVASPAVVGATVREVKPLSTIDQAKTVGRKAYEKSMARLRADLYWLAAQNLLHGLSVVLVFEGWDAGGKGGAIRRMVSALDARSYRVHQVSAPSDEERAHHYLWRFWRRLPEAGQVSVFDRSWYGRVLVERVESFCDGAGVAARLRRDPGLRGADHQPRHAADEVLAAHRQGRAGAAIPGAQGKSLQELEADRRGLAQPREVGRLRGRGQRHDRKHEHARGAVDSGPRQQQEARAPRSLADALRRAAIAAQPAGGGVSRQVGASRRQSRRASPSMTDSRWAATAARRSCGALAEAPAEGRLP